jgi:hypothetical protein
MVWFRNGAETVFESRSGAISAGETAIGTALATAKARVLALSPTVNAAGAERGVCFTDRSRLCSGPESIGLGCEGPGVVAAVDRKPGDELRSRRPRRFFCLTLEHAIADDRSDNNWDDDKARIMSVRETGRHLGRALTAVLFLEAKLEL